MKIGVLISFIMVAKCDQKVKRSSVWLYIIIVVVEIQSECVCTF